MTVHMTAQEFKKQKPSKYRAKKADVDGIIFDSIAESKRYGTLKMLQQAGHITGLELQPVYRCEVNGKHVCKAIYDFRYTDDQGRVVVEDVKSKITAKQPVYRLKKKLVEAIHGIKVTEVFVK